MKKIGKFSVLVVVVTLVFLMLILATPALAKEKEESPPGIQKNSGWTVIGDNLYTTDLNYNVGIGTTNPSGKLEVVGDIVVSGFVDGIDIDVTVTALMTSDATLQANIDAEEAARIAADNTLQININNLAAIDALDYDSLADLEAACANGFNIATVSGNVGIGTVTPSQKLDVVGNVHASGSFIAGSTTTYGDGYIGLSSGINLNIDSGTLFVDSVNDRVGIGTTSPGEELHVVGNVQIDGDLEVAGDARVSGEFEPEGGIVSSDTIIIESTGKKIQLIAGDSIITIDPTGGITIESKGDISINSQGTLDLSGKTVKITSGEKMVLKSGMDMEIDAGMKMEIESAMNMDIDAGLLLDIKGTSQLKLHSSGITDIRGSRIHLNTHLGGRPAARQNDLVMGFCPPFGGGLLGGNIALGSNTVFIG